MQEVLVVRCGQVPYEAARRAQKRIETARHRGALPDVLLVLEHPPVYTKGRRTDPGELPMGEDWYRMQGIEVTESDRGGRVTYHGPGQLVAYPIVSLRPYGDDVRGYVARMEEAMIAALGAWGVEAQVIDGLTGVWTAGEPPLPTGALGPQGLRVGGQAGGAEPARKVGAIGIHVNRGITTHGLAINVSNDLQPFEWIVACGIEAVRMTSLSRELGAEQDLDAFATTLAARFGEVYSRQPVETPASELAARVDGIEALAAAAPASVP